MTSYSRHTTTLETGESMRYQHTILISLLFLAACPTEDTTRCQKQVRNNKTTKLSGNCSERSFEGQDLSDADVSGATWGNTICPDDTNSDDNGGTCIGHLIPLPPEDDLPRDLEEYDHPDDTDLPQDDAQDPDAPDQPEDCSPNACGGCEELIAEPNTPCGACDSGTWTCGANKNLFCDGDQGEDALNVCGGCTALNPLERPLGEPCGNCGVGFWQCSGGEIMCKNDQGLGLCGDVCEFSRDCSEGLYCARYHCVPEGFAYIPAGEYTQGAPLSDPLRLEDETPHQTTITRPFLIGQNEITRQEWTNLRFYFNGEDLDCGEICPAHHLNWYEAIAWTNQRSLADGLPLCYLSPSSTAPYTLDNAIYQDEPQWPDGTDCRGWRLPTEAEWEYAAKANTTTPWLCGNNVSCMDAFAWYGINTDQPRTVGIKEPNAWEVYDIIGNVEEWVWDRYAPYPEEAQTDPTGKPTGLERVTRGASHFVQSPEFLRTSSRSYQHPDSRRDYIGFRIVRTLHPLTPEEEP